jgi:hypothetical protein
MSTNFLVPLSQRSILKTAEPSAKEAPREKIATTDSSFLLAKTALKALVLSTSIRYSISRELAALMQTYSGKD